MTNKQNDYANIKIPKATHNSILLLQVEILWRGIDSFKAPWIKDLLKSNSRQLVSKGNITGAGIICLTLFVGGKTKEEINRMSKDEVVTFLKENGYSLPPEWS